LRNNSSSGKSINSSSPTSSFKPPPLPTPSLIGSPSDSRYTSPPLTAGLQSPSRTAIKSPPRTAPSAGHRSPPANGNGNGNGAHSPPKTANGHRSPPIEMASSPPPPASYVSGQSKISGGHQESYASTVKVPVGNVKPLGPPPSDVKVNPVNGVDSKTAADTHPVSLAPAVVSS
jgi:hypothetical protein